MEPKEVSKRVNKHDGAYERRNPHRDYWLRRSFRGEVDEPKLRKILPKGMRAFTLVHRSAPGVRFRIVVGLPALYDTDCCNHRAKTLFERALGIADD